MNSIRKCHSMHFLLGNHCALYTNRCVSLSTVTHCTIVHVDRTTTAHTMYCVKSCSGQTPRTRAIARIERPMLYKTKHDWGLAVANSNVQLTKSQMFLVQLERTESQSQFRTSFSTVVVSSCQNFREGT